MNDIEQISHKMMEDDLVESIEHRGKGTSADAIAVFMRTKKGNQIALTASHDEYGKCIDWAIYYPGDKMDHMPRIGGYISDDDEVHPLLRLVAENY